MEMETLSQDDPLYAFLAHEVLRLKEPVFHPARVRELDSGAHG